MAKILFEITEDNLETGMRGYPVGFCKTSSVDPDKGLFYVGRSVSELAYWEPVNVIYLLYHGKEGSESEVKKFSDELKERGSCSDELLGHIRSLPKNGHPMHLFICSLMIADMLEGTKDYKEDCLNVIAKIPQLVANVINYHAGWAKAKPSDPNLGYMENFANMLNVPNADLTELTTVFKLFNILHYDHGGGNLSVFVGKAVASGLQDMWGSLAAAMSALNGPRHGKANQDSLNFVKKVYEEFGDNPDPAKLEEWIKHRLENKQLINGFGHAVLRVEDPRATVFYNLAKEKYPDYPLVKVALSLREIAPKVLKENPKIADPYPNVDGISGTVLSAAGFPYSDYFTVLFGLSRCVGVSRQIYYERVEARGGKGVPIIRPRYLYQGN